MASDISQPVVPLSVLLAGYGSQPDLGLGLPPRRAAATAPAHAPTALSDVGDPVWGRNGSYIRYDDGTYQQTNAWPGGQRARSHRDRPSGVSVDEGLLTLGIAGGGAYSGYKAISLANRASAARQGMDGLVAAADHDIAHIAAPRTSTEALAEAQALVGRGTINASNRLGRTARTVVDEVGPAAYSSLEDARRAATAMSPNTARGVFQAGEHYVPVSFDAGLNNLVQYYHYGNGRYSSGGWRDYPNLFGGGETREIAYDHFVTSRPGIVEVTSAEANQLSSEGTFAQKALADGRTAISEAPWKVPLFAALAVGCGVGAFLLYQHAQDN